MRKWAGTLTGTHPVVGLIIFKVNVLLYITLLRRVALVPGIWQAACWQEVRSIKQSTSSARAKPHDIMVRYMLRWLR